jgi:hypothetical protein
MDNEQLAADIEAAVNEAYQEFINFSDTKAKRRPAEGGWSPKEIIGHLIDSASNNHQRWVRLQIDDGLSFPEYRHDNEAWVQIQYYNEQSWEALLKFWRHFNLHMASVVRGVRQECLEHIWVVDEDTTVTLEALMAGYLEHLQDHIEQIRSSLKTRQ